MSSENNKISGRQIAAARELLNITQAQLAAAADVHSVVLSRIESGTVQPRDNTIAKVRDALERRGIEFLNGGSPGVRLHGEKSVIPV